MDSDCFLHKFKVVSRNCFKPIELCEAKNRIQNAELVNIHFTFFPYGLSCYPRFEPNLRGLAHLSELLSRQKLICKL